MADSVLLYENETDQQQEVQKSNTTLEFSHKYNGAWDWTVYKTKGWFI